jgi:hypothetical protein
MRCRRSTIARSTAPEAATNRLFVASAANRATAIALEQTFAHVAAAQHRPAVNVTPPPLASRERLTVDFDRPLDRALLEHSLTVAADAAPRSRAAPRSLTASAAGASRRTARGGRACTN